MAIVGWWLSSPPESIHSDVGARIAYASPGTVGCAVCHAEAIAYTDCMQCHIPTIDYTKAEHGVERDFYMGHHDLSSIAIIAPATTVLESCIDAACHNGSPVDARYVTVRSVDSHNYCTQCHTTKGEPGCSKSLCHYG